MPESDFQNVLAGFVEQARALAVRLSGDPEQTTVCHFCNGPLPLWENLLVVQLTGVAAHLECPPDQLAARLRHVGPAEDFPYDEFSAAVDRRMEADPVQQAAGEVTLD